MIRTLSATWCISKISITTLALVHSIAAHAIVMRHDVDPNAYLLNNFNYQSTFAINGCTATLIAPRWVLTAAHCVDPATTPGYKRFDKLMIMAEEVEILSVHIHPAFTIDGQGVHDIALFELSVPATGVIPTPPYEGDDEQGQILKLAGYGDVGDGVQGIYDRCFPCDLRGADNKVTFANDNHLRFRFDDPQGGESLALEGVGGGDDSGGPAFLDTNAGRFVAGVSSFGGKSYGDFDQYTRVSRELNWLKEVTGDEYPGFYSGPLYSATASGVSTPGNAGGGGTVAPILLLMALWFLLCRQIARPDRRRELQPECLLPPE